MLQTAFLVETKTESYSATADNKSSSPLVNDDHDETESLREALLAKTELFTLPNDPALNYRASQLNLCSFARPHMRAFHGSWILFHTAWIVWFGMAPLQPVIASDLGLTTEQLWMSNIWALIGAIGLRLILGPLCDQFGGRDTLIGVLVPCAIVCGLSGLLIQNYASLLIVRFLVGSVGGTLVPAQFWVTSHFTPACSGVAIAMSAGWGALGGGVSQVLMGSIIYPAFLNLLGNPNVAWRVAMIVPAILALSTSYFFYYYSDDCPLGNYREVKRAGLLQTRSAVDSFRASVFNVNAWILFVQFGAGLGIELTMEGGISLHLMQRFELDMTAASAYASIFGLMNIFARGVGGLLSDRLYRRYSLQGRLWSNMILILLEGILVLQFIRAKELRSAVFAMAAFAAAGQMSMGTTMGIVPYVDPRSTGAITGLVGAGGNVGGVLISNAFRTHTDFQGFHVMAGYCFVAALLTPLITIVGYRGILFGKEEKGGRQSLATPVKRLVPIEQA